MLHTRTRPPAAPPDPPAGRFRRTRRAYRSRGFAVFSALLLALIAGAGIWVALAGDEPPAARPPASSPAPQDGITPLLAAGRFLAAVADPADVYATVQDLTVPDAGQDLLLQRAAADPVAVTGVAGYEVAAARELVSTGDTATVAVVLRLADRSLVAVPVRLTWTGRAWLVQLPADGDLAATATSVPSLEGYPLWRDE